LKEKIGSKNEVIRRQESMIREQKDHINDLNRKNLSLEETIDLLNQKKALLEREGNENKRQILESAKLIQDNEKVSSSLSLCHSPLTSLCSLSLCHSLSVTLCHSLSLSLSLCHSLCLSLSVCLSSTRI
jgi:hypothetical protein